MFSKVVAVSTLSVVNGDQGNLPIDHMIQSRTYSGQDRDSFKYFDKNYMMSLVGTDGHDPLVLHQAHQAPKIGLTSMEKVVALTSKSTRASIRSQLVDLLKKQVRIESIYGTKKEKLYISAAAIYDFIAKLLHSACNIALSNDGMWQEQMVCFSAYRQLLEVYSMWNTIRDIGFALEHGMTVSAETLQVCGPQAANPEHFVAQTDESGRLQNQYLVSATLRSCYDNLQVRIEALRLWLSDLMVSSDSEHDQAQSCMFRVITVLTCLSSGNQENVLDLAIKEEHKQHQAYTLARYTSVALASADEIHPTQNDTASASFVQVESPQNLREVRPIRN